MVNQELWFDVEKERDTTWRLGLKAVVELWFDVEKERDTTRERLLLPEHQLWFDVEKERDTTLVGADGYVVRCGLM